MLPTDYSSLATAVQAYLHRTDVGVASGNLDYLIAEVEQELNARLRTRRQLTVVTPTVDSSGVVTLPADYGGWKRFQVRDGSREWDLDLLSPEQTTEVSSLYASTGMPQALITNGSSAQVWPWTNGTYTFAALYFSRIPNLTASATTNWVITNFPMVYLYGCLTAAQGFVADQAGQFELWASRFDHAVKNIVRESALDLDARSNETLRSDTSLFGGGGRVYNVMSDS